MSTSEVQDLPDKRKNSASRWRPVWIVAGIFALIVLVFGTLPMLGVLGYYLARHAATMQYKELQDIAEVKAPPPIETYNFAEDFRVKTADPGATHFIILRLSVGYSPGDQALTAELEQRAPQLRNIINLILMGKSKKDLTTIQQRLELQEEIKASFDHILSEGQITDVILLEFVVN